ncbi:MAG: NUDIX hydrolase [Actinobacteria bacterium]|nr:NUDIX hydrolase [Actinomycetota bacterium]
MVQGLEARRGCDVTLLDRLRGGKLVRAAGGVVVRPGPEVLLVHRPKYGDWTFPKGKADDGESDVDCALREVEEETGFRCRLESELPSTRYRDSRGRRKVVRWWRMSVEGGEFEGNREVDEIRWLRPENAAGLLSYERDLPLLEALRG